MEPTNTATTAPSASKMIHHYMPLAEVFEQMSNGKVSGDNWMVDDCGNLKIMLHNTTAKNLEESSECCQDLAVFDVKVMIATNCLQKKAWGRAIEYSKAKYANDYETSEEYKEDVLEMHNHSKPKEIIINL